MATNLEIITDALRDINVISEIDTASAEQGALGLRKLNDLMESWIADEIDVGFYPQTSTTDECPVPAWAVRSVKLGLSIAVAANYGATVSPELVAELREGKGVLQRKSIVDRIRPQDMSHMPLGTGWRGGFDITR